MNTICYKTYILQILNHTLTNSLIAIAIIYSLSKTYSILKTIQLSTSEDKLSTDGIINHILMEEKSQSSQSTSQNMFITYLGKKKGKIQDKEQREQKKADNTKLKSSKCAYCKKKGYYKAKYRKMKCDLKEKDNSKNRE